jgi:hypothetical protein
MARIEIKEKENNPEFRVGQLVQQKNSGNVGILVDKLNANLGEWELCFVVFEKCLHGKVRPKLLFHNLDQQSCEERFVPFEGEIKLSSF